MSVAAGLDAHLAGAGARHLVIGSHQRPRRLVTKRTLVDEMMRRRPKLIVHVVPTEASGSNRSEFKGSVSAAHFAIALAAVALTVVLALVLRKVADVEYLSFLFFFPVIGSAARLGTKPAMVAAIACAVAFNFFFLAPLHLLRVGALQSWIMGAALLATAVYTGALTANLRARAVLSERSAQENASIASFVAELTRAADWDSTAQVICSQIGALLAVQTLLVRDLSGSFAIIGSSPPAQKS